MNGLCGLTTPGWMGAPLDGEWMGLRLVLGLCGAAPNGCRPKLGLEAAAACMRCIIASCRCLQVHR